MALDSPPLENETAGRAFALLKNRLRRTETGANRPVSRAALLPLRESIGFQTAF